MRMLLDAAGHPNVGTLFDPCNYFRLGDDPVAAFDTLQDKVFYCHLKGTVATALGVHPDGFTLGQ